MEHAITIKDVIFVSLGAMGFVGVVGLLFFLISVFNPFSSGH